MQSQVMERALDGVETMVVSQTRRGCFQECLGCEAKTEFKYFKGDEKFAESLEEASFCCRCWLAPAHEFKMVVKEDGTNEEILSMDRPYACMFGSCKCCCLQEMTMSSGGQPLGSVKEDYWYCVPSMQIYDTSGNAIYKIHQPTCCGGCCVNCCAEGLCNCKVPFHVFPASQEKTDDGAEYVGMILKRAKGVGSEIFTDADRFELSFPAGSTIEQKALLVGTTIFINANFFESSDGGGGD